MGNGSSDSRSPGSLPEKSTAGARLASADREIVYLVFGNHARLHGIGEVLYSLYICLCSRYRTRLSHTVQPGRVNIIIDEFFNPYFVEQLKQIRKSNPDTRYIVVATEFVTA